MGPYEGQSRVQPEPGRDSAGGGQSWDRDGGAGGTQAPHPSEARPGGDVTQPVLFPHIPRVQGPHFRAWGYVMKMLSGGVLALPLRRFVLI